MLVLPGGAPLGHKPARARSRIRDEMCTICLRQHGVRRWDAFTPPRHACTTNVSASGRRDSSGSSSSNSNCSSCNSLMTETSFSTSIASSSSILDTSGSSSSSGSHSNSHAREAVRSTAELASAVCRRLAYLHAGSLQARYAELQACPMGVRLGMELVDWEAVSDRLPSNLDLLARHLTPPQLCWLLPRLQPRVLGSGASRNNHGATSMAVSPLLFGHGWSWEKTGACTLLWACSTRAAISQVNAPNHCPPPNMCTTRPAGVV